jgi:hypothetical protein
MAITVVQQATATGIGTGNTIAYGSNLTTGNLMVVAVLHSYNGCPPSISSDTLGSTFTKRVDNVAVGTRRAHIWTAPIPSGGANTLTFSMSCGSNSLTAIYELSGHDTTTPFGGSNSSTNTANPVLSGSITPTVNGSFLAAMMFTASGGSFTPMSGWDERYDSGGLFAQDDIQTTAATINPEATVSALPADVFGISYFINAASGGSTFFRPYFITG